MLNALAFPSLGWWPLAWIGTPLILLSLVGRSVKSALLVGAGAGAVFWGMHIFWLTVYLGPAPWAALVMLQTLFFGLFCTLIALAWRFTDRAGNHWWLRYLIAPAVIGGLWVARETVTSTWPYGGFSWGRLAFSQSESPFGDLASWVGVTGLSFIMAAMSALLAQFARRTRPVSLPRNVGIAAVALTVVVSVPSFPVVTNGTLRVGAVQGNADAGLFSRPAPGEILDNHIAASEPLVGQDADVVVWPENASDIDPLRNNPAARALTRISEQLGAPLITGTLTQSGTDDFNSLLLWDGEGGAVDQYDKLHPVPFAEYLPDREFWTPLAPELFSLIPRDFTRGSRDNIFTVANLRAGLAICFDIVDDALIRQMMADGAQIIISPTNNADFGRSDQSIQQLAIARIRAIETGRSVVNVSTVGVSAIIDPSGRTMTQLPTFQPGTMLANVPLSDTITPATAAGGRFDAIPTLIGLAGLVLTGVITRRTPPHERVRVNRTRGGVVRWGARILR
ncbi:apolipoprotein N-acyltransferase [Plantibacter sp. T3]|uniref:apolipoprotein N-acyltransferase n=1 Tax=Plantibacter sp. T3 TaxID=2653161 RepID=UPI0012F02EC1|nr:apolipoprotein N-acyltransferase [Plantibacter sp. T3]VXB06346.1 Apolipoprotein N-acyltransferase [Plantibacter sp. T3]